MNRGVHGVTKSQTQLTDLIPPLHLGALFFVFPPLESNIRDQDMGHK